LTIGCLSREGKIKNLANGVRFVITTEELIRPFIIYEAQDDNSVLYISSLAVSSVERGIAQGKARMGMAGKSSPP
jgi:hypothetical protein